MQALFADLPEALENAVEIARRCNLGIELGKNRLPQFPTPEGVTLDDYPGAAGASRPRAAPGAAFSGSRRRATEAVRVCARASISRCKTIQQMGFPGYFLIVADFINWAKKNGVPVGPGRGSGAGSLVAYSLASPTSTRCATSCCSSAS
jgi:DNA polymerase-3 subunit alpha